MKNIIIVDEIFSNNDLNHLKMLIGDSNLDLKFYLKDESHCYKYYVDNLIGLACNYFNLKKYIGYELWTRNNIEKVDWHYDKDEWLFNKENKLSFPILSMVFYVSVKNLKGGRLHISDDLVVKPKENRLVLFPQGIKHCTSIYTGQRNSFLINPWDKVPNSYL